MKKLSRWLAAILVICLVAAPVTASADGTDGGAASLTYRNIQISVDGETITPTDVTGAVTEPVILNDSTYLPVRAVAEALGCDVKWTDATSTVSIESADTESTDELYAGAGAAPMKFDAAMFPMEGFSGEVNDDPYARVLVLGSNTKTAIVSLELVNASAEAIQICKEVVSEKCGVPESRIWVHATHAITTMHAPSEQDKNELYLNSVRTAITAAAEQAAGSYQPAVMGVGTGTCDVNANRDIELNGQWYYGLGSELESNKTMTILRFDNLDGKPIGFFISYGIKPTCIDNVEKETNTRKISADVPGYACVMMEKEFGVPAMFCMPAAGDQIPAKTAMYYELDENGEAKEVKLTVEEGIALMEEQGKVMGDDAITIAKGITCTDKTPEIAVQNTAFTYPTKAGDGVVTIEVSGMQIGKDVAFVGFKPEVNAITELQLWEKSPYENTLLVSFLNGDQKYMPDEKAYERNTWEAKRAGGAAGCAEKFVEVSAEMLTNIKNRCEAASKPYTGHNETLTANVTYRGIKIEVNGSVITPTDAAGKTVEPFILNGSTYLPIRAVCEALGCEVGWDDATSTVNITSAKNVVLKAGAGAAPMKFDAAMFPVEGFSGEVNDDPYARVLVLGKGAKSAIVSLELVNASSEAIRICKEVVSEKCGVPESRIWVHATHAITTMHAPGEQDKNEMYLKSVRDAITAAAEQAAESYQPAVMGVGTGTCDVNANRDIELNGKWYYGLGSELESNKTMTILRFDNLDGKPIGFFISYGIKPTCIDNVEKETSTRKISADVPGYACVMMEKEFGVPAMFCMPAAGDQIPAKIAMYYELGENGEAKEVKLTVEEGIALMEEQGEVMGNDAIAIAKGIACTDNAPELLQSATSFTWANKAGDGEITVDVTGLQIGKDVALVGFKPEVNAVTELQLWEASPYKHTLLVSFLNGDQKYMPDEKGYERDTWEAKRAGGAVGCAEEFVKVSAELLRDMQAGKTSDKTSGGQTGGGSIADYYATVEFAGIKWYAIDKKDGKTLLLSQDVLEKRAYHAAGGDVTWEESELRAYLNGEFYEKTFSNEDKAKIAEVTLENKSNSKYGIRGGNATTDKVFLLSLDEAGAYLFDFTGVTVAKDSEGNACWWHLRSPGEAKDVQACVTANGQIDYHGPTEGVTDPEGGIRAAIWVTLG